MVKVSGEYNLIESVEQQHRVASNKICIEKYVRRQIEAIKRNPKFNDVHRLHVHAHRRDYKQHIICTLDVLSIYIHRMFVYINDCLLLCGSVTHTHTQTSRLKFFGASASECAKVKVRPPI